jgi:hypothetical protein
LTSLARGHNVGGPPNEHKISSPELGALLRLTGRWQARTSKKFCTAVRALSAMQDDGGINIINISISFFNWRFKEEQMMLCL